jgi:hypothetical protein
MAGLMVCLRLRLDLPRGPRIETSLTCGGADFDQYSLNWERIAHLILYQRQQPLE